MLAARDFQGGRNCARQTGVAGTWATRIAPRRAEPRATMPYDRARKNLDRHLNYILGADMAAGT